MTESAMRIPFRYLVMHTDRPVEETGTNLRGYIGSKFPEYPLLHHHLDKPMLTYPKVQYKVIGGTPSILGIEDGASVIGEIADDITELVFRTGRYEILQKVSYDQKIPIMPVRDPIQYRFVSPWMALNEDNYRKYQVIHDWKERKQFLNRILIGNFLSMAKGLGIVIEERLIVKSMLEQVPIRYKGVKMTGFIGSFLVNLQMPDYLGIGKGVSQGFGSIRKSVPGPDKSTERT
ncbi:CRISPR-associated endonuclease Cas6 [Methanospirillum sp.]|uniref:CRISPR-associated endonuclease Cas6 n=1 Tax=Methanospirillum sp. TaxID=45200 RepID=UPI0035A02C67